MHTISSESERDVFILKTGPLNFTIVTGGLNPEGYYQNQWNSLGRNYWRPNTTKPNFSLRDVPHDLLENVTFNKMIGFRQDGALLYNVMDFTSLL